MMTSPFQRQTAIATRVPALSHGFGRLVMPYGHSRVDRCARFYASTIFTIVNADRNLRSARGLEFALFAEQEVTYAREISDRCWRRGVVHRGVRLQHQDG